MPNTLLPAPHPGFEILRFQKKTIEPATYFAPFFHRLSFPAKARSFHLLITLQL